MQEAMQLSQERMQQVEEVRLRCGNRLSVVCLNRELEIGKEAIGVSELRDLLSRAARYSVQSYQEDLSRGFLPLEGGHRLGLCGTIARNNGEIVGYRTVSSACIRIAREIPGAATALYQQLAGEGYCKSALLVAPPGLGKTTLLRDLIRCCSFAGLRVGVVDERSELAALYNGKPQFELGSCVDVIEGADKSEAAMRLIRTMSPQVLAMDEITEERDLRTVQTAMHCGVTVLATAHGINGAELLRKPLFRELLEQKVFDCLVVIRRKDGSRTIEIEEVPC